MKAVALDNYLASEPDSLAQPAIDHAKFRNNRIVDPDPRRELYTTLAVFDQHPSFGLRRPYRTTEAALQPPIRVGINAFSDTLPSSRPTSSAVSLAQAVNAATGTPCGGVAA